MGSHLLLQAQWTNILHNSDNSTHNFNMKAVMLIVVAVVVICEANRHGGRGDGFIGGNPGPNEGQQTQHGPGSKFDEDRIEADRICSAKIKLISTTRGLARTILTTAQSSVQVLIEAARESPAGVTEADDACFSGNFGK